MSISRKRILPAFAVFVYAVFFAAIPSFGAASAVSGTERDMHRILKYYTAAYNAEKLSDSEVASLKKTASKSAPDALRLGLWNYQNKRYEDAFSAVSRAAGQNDPDGILLQGIFYLNKTGTKEKSKGAPRIAKAAENGHPVAQYILGSMYAEGYGVSQKSEESKSWHERAAKQGVNSEVMISQSSFQQALAAWRKKNEASAAATPAKPPAETQAGSGKRTSPEAAKTSSSSSSSSSSAPLKPGDTPVMNRVAFKSENPKMPDPNGVSLSMLQNAWDRLRKVTGINAWLLYDDEDILNAYMTKNNKGEFVVVVYRGLMKIFRTEDEIAGVLGHESGHAAMGHLEKGRNQQVGINVAASVLSSLLGNSVADIAIGAGAELAKSGYSREAEVEADDYGTEHAAKAGYTPFALYNAVKRMADAGAVTPPSGFNSHPPTERRMKRLKDKAEYWQKQTGK